MLYLTYEEYQSIGGVVDESAFKRYIFKACSIIDKETFNRVEKESIVPDCVKYLCRDLVEYFSNHDSTEKNISSKSESAGVISESVSYVNKSAKDISEEIERTLSDYLDSSTNSNGVAWRYRGYAD